METPPKPSVLFLEDDADTRELVKYTLEHAGMTVVPAETVAQAWSIAIAQEIDLYLLDGMIPHGSSLQLCQFLRAIEPDKPIVFYSGLAYQADVQRGIDAGATAYLVKPYSGDLGEEILRYIHGGKFRKSVEPLFMDKQNAVKTFVTGSESGPEVSAQISEFPASFDRAGNIEQFEATRSENPIRLRNIRSARTSGGII